MIAPPQMPETGRSFTSETIDSLSQRIECGFRLAYDRNQRGGSAGRSVGMPWRRQIRWTAAAVQRPAVYPARRPGGAMDPSSAPAMRRRDQPRIRPPQINITTWSSCSPTSWRTRLRAATRPARVLIFRRLGMTLDMIHTRRDQVEPGQRPYSSFLAPIGRDRGGTSLL